MHVDEHFLHIVKYLLSGLKMVVRALSSAIVANLRHRGEDHARNAQTASVIRGSRIRLSWYERLAVRVHRLLGLGDVEGLRNDCLETWVDVTPPGVRLAAAARARFSAGSQGWWNDDYQ